MLFCKKANELVHEFDAKSVEDLIEPNFVSISAYTNEWKESIKTEKHRMNLQVSLRNAGMGENLPSRLAHQSSRLNINIEKLGRGGEYLEKSSSAAVES